MGSKTEGRPFRFKQFEIHQDRCAMKIGTDGVMLGGWVDVEGAQTALDIGAGTGLISLMIAQRSPYLQITAVEIDVAAASQAQENVEASIFKDRINVIQTSIQELDHSEKFDLVVSNPPFFNADTKSPVTTRNLARHDSSLSLHELMAAAHQYLTEKGKVAVVWPREREVELDEVAEQFGFYPSKVLEVYPTPEKECRRVLKLFRRDKTATITKKIVIEEFGRHGYSKPFIELLKDFYLAF